MNASDKKYFLYFTHAEYRGDVVNYDFEAKYYKVRYEDGDEEDMSDSEIEDFLVSSVKVYDEEDSESDLDSKPKASNGSGRSKSRKRARPRKRNAAPVDRTESPPRKKRRKRQTIIL